MKACAIEHKYATCADCTEFNNLKDCRKLNNIIANFFGFIFRTDRIENLNRIRKSGMKVFIEEKLREGKA